MSKKLFAIIATFLSFGLFSMDQQPHYIKPSLQLGRPKLQQQPAQQGYVQGQSYAQPHYGSQPYAPQQYQQAAPSQPQYGYVSYAAPQQQELQGPQIQGPPSKQYIQPAQSQEQSHIASHGATELDELKLRRETLQLETDIVNLANQKNWNGAQQALNTLANNIKLLRELHPDKRGDAFFALVRFFPHLVEDPSVWENKLEILKKNLQAAYQTNTEMKSSTDELLDNLLERSKARNKEESPSETPQPVQKSWWNPFK